METQSKTINGIKFYVSPFPAIVALQLKVHLLKVLGPALGRLIGSVDGVGESSISEMKLNGEGIAQALESLFSQIGEGDFISLLSRLFGGVSCEVPGEKGKATMVDFQSDFDNKMDIVFSGKLMTIYPLIYFVLEVNFPDFFGQMAGIGGQLKTKMSKLAKGNAKD